ncbi:MAG TPA: ATP-grasp domain-containing protein [Acidimicrobiales bacterium]|nr:ATP-grasp domain-containing protein [Acidimicrobiales bacterium]
MPRVLLLVPSFTYRAADFVAAAGRLGAEVVVGSDRRQALAKAMGDRAVVVPLENVAAGVAAIEELHGRAPIHAVVAVDDQGILVAATAADALGFPHNPPDAVARTRDKSAMRAALRADLVSQPDFVVLGAGDGAAAPAYPCVVKPTGLSASQGVIRVDDPTDLAATIARVRAICGDHNAPVIVETYVSGDEIAIEGLLEDGKLHVLAVFDKPDPLEGPYFEETLYVTPSRHDVGAAADLVQRGCDALGLREGPVHAEVRLGASGEAWLIEVAARSIGGLCSRALSFGAGISLEEVIVRHALGRPLADLSRERAASGVMMLPIARAGMLDRVDGQDAARRVPGVVGLEITVARGRKVVPLPEGSRYLGFVFARGATPADVESALRAAHACLDVVIT